MARYVSKATMTIEEVVDALRQRIVDNELSPGVKLREVTIAEEFGVSRPRLREAFGILEERGLIERVRNHGAVVTRPTISQIQNLFDVREVLEALAVRLATENAPPGTWEVFLERFGEPGRRALEANQLNYYIEALNDFRRATVQHANNDILAQNLDRLYDRTRLLVHRLVAVPGRAIAAREEHRKIIEAMVAGEADRAEQLKRDNIRNARRWFMDYKNFLL